MSLTLQASLKSPAQQLLGREVLPPILREYRIRSPSPQRRDCNADAGLVLQSGVSAKSVNYHNSKISLIFRIVASGRRLRRKEENVQTPITWEREAVVDRKLVDLPLYALGPLFLADRASTPTRLFRLPRIWSTTPNTPSVIQPKNTKPQ